MSELRSMTVSMVDNKMLKEVDRVKNRDELHGHQIFVGPQGLGFGTDGGVASQPLQEGLVFLSHISFQVLQVLLASLLLPGMWCTELLGQGVFSLELCMQLDAHIFTASSTMNCGRKCLVHRTVYAT